MANLEAIRHHSATEVKGYVEDALKIVDEVELDDDLRGIAFSKAIELLAGKLFLQPEAPVASVNLEHLLGKR